MESSYHRNYNQLIMEKILQSSPEKEKSNYPHNEQKKIQSKPQPIEITIDMGNGTETKIVVTKNDNPLIVARKFCFSHNLDTKIISILSQKIKQQIQLNNMNESIRQTQNNEPNASYHSIQDMKSKKNKQNVKINRSHYESQKQFHYSDKKIKQLPVHQRLYNQSKRKLSMTSSVNYENNQIRHSSLSKKNSNSLNNGVLIYERNVRLSQQNKKKLQKKSEEMRNSTLSALTFKPSINSISKIMIQKMRQEGSLSIIQRTKQLEHKKLLQIRLQKEKEQMQECTFKPNINKKYQKTELSRSQDRFNLLYEDWNQRQNRKEQIKNYYSKKDYSFHPTINKISEIIINGVPFEERLKRYSEQKILKQQKIKKQKFIQKSIEVQTGQQLYKPKIGKAPQHRNVDCLPIGDYLFKYKLRRQHQQLKQIKLADSNLNILRSNLNSSKLYQQNKLNSFQEIFRLLDHDSDKVISSTKININELDPKVLKIFAPLLAEMEEIKVQLDEQEFIQSAQKLFKTLTVYQKNLILNHHKYKKNQENTLFRPSLNQRSLEIAQQIRPTIIPGVSIYQYCQDKKQRKQQKMNQIRKKNKQYELQQCTFHPKIVKNKR